MVGARCTIALTLQDGEEVTLPGFRYRGVDAFSRPAYREVRYPGGLVMWMLLPVMALSSMEAFRVPYY